MKTIVFTAAQVDSKKEVEKALKSVCEAFIMAATKLAVEPLLSFITKVRPCGLLVHVLPIVRVMCYALHQSQRSAIPHRNNINVPEALAIRRNQLVTMP